VLTWADSKLSNKSDLVENSDSSRNAVPIMLHPLCTSKAAGTFLVLRGVALCMIRDCPLALLSGKGYSSYEEQFQSSHLLPDITTIEYKCNATKNVLFNIIFQSSLVSAHHKLFWKSRRCRRRVRTSGWHWNRSEFSIIGTSFYV